MTMTMGDWAGSNERQVTGVVVTGTATNPVVYVSSSDRRRGAGGGGGDVNLDTNSGVITQLTKKWEYLGSNRYCTGPAKIGGKPCDQWNAV